jgi:hypothetical protein
MVCLRNISVDTLHKGDTKDNNNLEAYDKCILYFHRVVLMIIALY